MAAAREKKKRLQATKITGDVNAKRVEQLRRLSVKVPGSDKNDGSGPRKVGLFYGRIGGSRSYTRGVCWCHWANVAGVGEGGGGEGILLLDYLLNAVLK